MVSGKHSIFTHFQKDRKCDICLRTNITRASCWRRTGSVVPRAEHFGDLITADHKVLGEGKESRDNHRYAVVAQDLTSQWIQSYPCKTKTSQETEKSFQKFLEPTMKPKVVYTDNSLEFGKYCEDLSLESLFVNTAQIGNKWNCRESSAQSERRDICGVVAFRPGWKMVGDLLSDGKTPYERRFGIPFDGPVIQFGAMVKYHPISAQKTCRNCISSAQKSC